MWQTELVPSRYHYYLLLLTNSTLALCFFITTSPVTISLLASMLIWFIYCQFRLPKQIINIKLQFTRLIYQNKDFFFTQKPLLFQFVIILNIYCTSTGKKRCLVLFADSFSKKEWREFHTLLQQKGYIYDN